MAQKKGIKMEESEDLSILADANEQTLTKQSRPVRGRLLNIGKTLNELKTSQDYYCFDEPFKQIAELMKKRGLKSIGSYTQAQQRSEQHDRSASIDINIRERAVRSLFIVKMTESQLDWIHRLEWDKLDRFLTPLELRAILKKRFSLNMPSSALGNDQMDALIALNNENRPKCGDLDGVTIPPYFILDYDFCGTLYHHSWDKNVFNANFILPESEQSGKRIRKTARYEATPRKDIDD